MPTALFFSEIYLRSHFKAEDITFIPIQYASQIKNNNFDIAISQGSIQEMPEDMVNSWCEVIARSAFSFLSINYPKTPIKLPNNWKMTYCDSSPELKTILDTTEVFEERFYVRS